MAQLVFEQSKFVPIAIGFFGLGVGYFVWGGQALFRVPPLNADVNRTMGLWGIWMPGFMQFITGVYLLVGLTWFNVFREAPLYMAALAFTAYGVHWFVMGHRRFIAASSGADGWMAIPFALLSILGIVVFTSAGDVPVAILFVALALVYVSEIPARFSGSPRWERPGRSLAVLGRDLVNVPDIRDGAQYRAGSPLVALTAETRNPSMELQQGTWRFVMLVATAKRR